MMLLALKIESIQGNQAGQIAAILKSSYMSMIDTEKLSNEQILRAFYRKILFVFRERPKGSLEYACFAELLPSLILL